MKILVIDHDPLALAQFVQILGDLAEMETAQGCVAGLAATARLLPDLVLCDGAIPDIDGVTFCRHLQADILTRDIPVLLGVDATLGEAGELAALAAGAIDVFRKPLSPQLVRARVKIQIELCLKSMRLLELARRDPLTGIFNRRYFDERLGDEWARHKRAGKAIGVAMVDVDRFKEFNDYYGHVRGDECLMAVADSLRHQTRRPGELAARYGGEEFVLLLPTTSFAAADRFGQSICEGVRNLRYPHACAQGGLLTVSVGLASVVPCDALRPADLVRQADEALYAAKQSGRDRHALYRPARPVDGQMN
jgi:diguanylate cyclase (GGDEF)-like protein